MAGSSGGNFTILHISDLHRSATDPITNEELVSALISDRSRYRVEPTPIPDPKAIVVSGDLIQGVGLNTANYRDELEAQYRVAETLIDELTKRFLNGDRSRVIIIPGNHDVDWNTAYSAMVPVPDAEIPAGIGGELASEKSGYRWDWKSRTLYRINDPDLYAQRMDAFWKFFERFYGGVPGLLKVAPRSDANLFELCNGRIAVAAYNSCFGNDCFAFHGMIPKEAIAQSDLDLNDLSGPHDLRIAVWHHNIEGPPYRSDYMDVEHVHGMIGRDFRLGLYGHHHKSQIVPHHIWLPGEEKMVAVSAGSLCAGRYDLPTGHNRQYNLIEIAEDMQSARIHVRAMEVANLFAPARLLDFGGRSYAELAWSQPRNAVGGKRNPEASRLARIIQDAELAAKTGDPRGAIERLKRIALPNDSYQRRLLVDTAFESRDWATLIEVATPPATIEELTYLLRAHIESGSISEARKALSGHAVKLEMPDDIQKEFELQIKVKETMSR